MKKILAQLNEVITELEDSGFVKESNIANDIFLRLAQANVFGPNAYNKTKMLKSKLGGLGADGSWGPAVGDQIKRIFDGARISQGLKTNQFNNPYQPDYAKRALDAFNQSSADVRSKIANNNSIYSAADVSSKSGDTHTIAQPGIMRPETIFLLTSLVSY